MTDRELKEKLSSIYNPGQSEKGRQFVRSHEQRSMQLKDIIINEFRFMSRQSVLSGVLLCAVLILVSMHDSTTTLWFLSSFLPLFALLITSVMERSERYGMSELEAACRFSIRFVRMVRMLIIGTASLVLILVSALVARSSEGNSFAVVLCYVSLPYLLNVFSNLLITRKRHTKDDIFFCCGATCFSCLLPTIARALKFSRISDTAAALLIIAAVAAVSEETIKYIKEENRILWNW